MKITKIGTFEKNGMPTGWVLAPESEIGLNYEPKVVEADEYCLGIIEDKVFVNGVEVVEWTAARLERMGR